MMLTQKSEEYVKVKLTSDRKFDFEKENIA